MLGDLTTAFGLVFLAELPDKTMFATLLLSTRYPRRSAVWAGVAAAYSMHVVVAVLLGSLLSRLPEAPVRRVVAVLFVAAGLYLVWNSRRRAADEQATGRRPEPVAWGSVFAVSFATVGVAEFADITQFTTASLAATRDSTVGVALGAAGALVSVSGLAVYAGRVVVRRVRLQLVQRAAGALFVVIGALTFVGA